jgi:hypothetical protein
MSAQLRPVVGPILPKLLQGNPRRRSERLALIGRHPARSPVEDRLDILLTDSGSEWGEPPRPLHGGIELGFGKQHEPILHAGFTTRQEEGATVTSDLPHTSQMGRDWKQFQEELDRRGKGLQWLADRMGCSIQRVQNWTTRGVPRGAYPELAAALGQTIDWVAGNEPRRPDPVLPSLSNSAMLVALAYDRMTPAEKMRLDRLMAAALDIDLSSEQVPHDRGGLSGLSDLDEHEQSSSGDTPKKGAG